MAVAYFCSGVQNKRYNGQQEDWVLWKGIWVLLKKKHQSFDWCFL